MVGLLMLRPRRSAGEAAVSLTFASAPRLLPLLIGVGILFWSGKNIVGWLLTIAGALFILAGVIANMHIYFRPTSLFNTLVMLILFVGGLGLIARALMPQGKNANE